MSSILRAPTGKSQVPNTVRNVSGSPWLLVSLCKFRLAVLRFLTQSPVSVFMGFASIGLMWHYFMRRLWKRSAVPCFQLYIVHCTEKDGLKLSIPVIPNGVRKSYFIVDQAAG